MFASLGDAVSLAKFLSEFVKLSPRFSALHIANRSLDCLGIIAGRKLQLPLVEEFLKGQLNLTMIELLPGELGETLELLLRRGHTRSFFCGSVPLNIIAADGNLARIRATFPAIFIESSMFVDVQSNQEIDPMFPAMFFVSDRPTRSPLRHMA